MANEHYLKPDDQSGEKTPSGTAGWADSLVRLQLGAPIGIADIPNGKPVCLLRALISAVQARMVGSQEANEPHFDSLTIKI